MQISLKTLGIYKDKIDFFINHATCCTMLWPVFDAWITGEAMVGFDCITDGETLYAQGYPNGKPQLKIGDTINRKKYIYDHTYHFYKSVDMGISFKIGGLKRRVIEKINIDINGEALRDKLCCASVSKDSWGREYSHMNIKVCRRRHKTDYCSGFMIGIHGKYFCESDFLTKNVSEIPYCEDFNKIFSIMNRYPKIARP